MRTHPSTDYDFSDYDALSREQKNYLASIINEDRVLRYEQMEEHKCQPFPERGIRLHTLPAGSGVQEIVQQQGWQQFIRTRRGYAANLVAEFYGCMHPATYCYRDTVVVRGVTVRISAQDICNYHGLTYKPHLINTYGLSGDELFETQYNPVVAASLRRNAYPHWDASHRYSLFKSDLHHELGFLMLFIKASLKPSRHNTTADQQVAEVLYSLQHNLDIDAGQIIWQELLDAGVKLDGVLPFPCMITDFCIQAGLQADLAKGPEDLYSKHLTIQINAHRKLNDKRLESGEAWEREMAIREFNSEGEEDDDEYIPEPEAPPQFQQAPPQFQYPPYQPQMPQYVFPDGTPQYIYSLANQMTQHMNLEMGHIHQRLDLWGCPQIDPYQGAAPAQAPHQAAPPAPGGTRGRRRVRPRGDGASSSNQAQEPAARAARRR